ncbi:MAG: IS1634 family transposase [Polyangia bacterium]
MYIEKVPNRNSPPAILLRQGWREGKKVKKKTIANLSHWPEEKVETLRLLLKDKRLAPVDELFEKTKTVHHGHVQSVLQAVDKLGLDKLISAKRCQERDIIVAAITARICKPDSKLAMSRWWKNTTLPEILEVGDADEDDIYEAMDWLLARQKRIEKKLAKRHLEDEDLVLYDLTSSYFEGVTCPLATLGKSRDRKRNTMQVNYGLVSDRRGCPVAVSVFKGNKSDSKTLLPQARRVHEDFGIERVVLVGDRGMISQKQIDVLRDEDGFDWITALKSGGIRKLVEGGALQLDLFDERNLFELEHEDYPGERLVACRNPVLARKRAYKRESMLEATEQELAKIRTSLKKGTLKKKERTKDRIGVRVGKVVNKYNMAKHMVLHIKDNSFDFELNQQSIAAEAALDGIYIIRTSLPEESMKADEAVRSYKDLTSVERAFKSLKSIDLMVRPIRHRTEDRVRAHIFLSMLTYYVQWHMLEAWRPLLFADEDQEAKKSRDPVAPAKRSKRALKKARTKKLDDGTDVESFRTLLEHMSTITRDTCRQRCDDESSRTFTIDTTPNEKQSSALKLLAQIPVYP